MWHASVEKLLQKYCDEAQVRESLHRRAYYWYKKTLSWFQLPIIILSAASGSVQFLSKGFPVYESMLVTGTATLSIIVSIVSSVMTYLKLGETKSKHELAQINWQGFYNKIAHQLALDKHLREDAAEFLELVKSTYERLFELSPMISSQFVDRVKKKIKKYGTQEFQIPVYLNGFAHTRVWDNQDDSKSEEFIDNSINEV